MADELTEYTVLNNAEKIVFNGRRLAHATTERPNDPRWTEIDIYVTGTGTMIVSRIGKSLVYHVVDGPCNFGVATPGAELPPDAEPCAPSNQRGDYTCRPPALDDPAFDPDARYALEMNFHSAAVCHDPAEVPRHLVYRRNGREFLSSVSQRVLEMAMEKYPPLRDAMSPVRRVT